MPASVRQRAHPIKLSSYQRPRARVGAGSGRRFAATAQALLRVRACSRGPSRLRQPHRPLGGNDGHGFTGGFLRLEGFFFSQSFSFIPSHSLSLASPAMRGRRRHPKHTPRQHVQALMKLPSAVYLGASQAPRFLFRGPHVLTNTCFPRGHSDAGASRGTRDGPRQTAKGSPKGVSGGSRAHQRRAGVGEHDSMTGTKRSDCLVWSVPAGGSDFLPLDVRMPGSAGTATWSGSFWEPLHGGGPPAGVRDEDGTPRCGGRGRS